MSLESLSLLLNIVAPMASIVAAIISVSTYKKIKVLSKMESVNKTGVIEKNDIAVSGNNNQIG